MGSCSGKLTSLGLPSPESFPEQAKGGSRKVELLHPPHGEPESFPQQAKGGSRKVELLHATHGEPESFPEQAKGGSRKVELLHATHGEPESFPEQAKGGSRKVELLHATHGELSRCLLHVSFENAQLEWYGKSVDGKVIGEEYDDQATQTGEVYLIHHVGNSRTADLRGIANHKVDPRHGLVFGGDHARATFKDDHMCHTTLGYAKLPSVAFSGPYSSCRVRFFAPRTQSNNGCLFHMSNDGWSIHFSLFYTEKGTVMFQICPTQHFDGWEKRKQIETKTILAPRDQPYEVFAVTRSDGWQLLYVDGVLEAEGPGVQGMTESWNGTREYVYIGRWMRADQSYPLMAGLVDLALFDEHVR